LTKALRWAQGLLFGDPELQLVGSMRRNAVRDGMNFENACSVLSYEDAQAVSSWRLPGDDRACATVLQGVFNNGLQAAYSLYIDTATRVFRHLLTVSQDANVTRIRSHLQGSDVHTIDVLERGWLTSALRLEGHMYLDEQLHHLHTTIQTRTIMLAVFVTALVLCYFTIYGPLVQQMDAQLKRVRGLLVMIPVEIAQAIPSLRHLLLGAPPS